MSLRLLNVQFFSVIEATPLMSVLVLPFHNINDTVYYYDWVSLSFFSSDEATTYAVEAYFDFLRTLQIDKSSLDVKEVGIIDENAPATKPQITYQEATSTLREQAALSQALSTVRNRIITVPIYLALAQARTIKK